MSDPRLPSTTTIRCTSTGDNVRLKHVAALLTVICLATLAQAIPAQAATTASAATAAADWNGDQQADVIGATSDGKLWLYPGSGAGSFSNRRQIGTGWTSRDQIRMVGNWDGIAGTDIIARDHRNGDLWLYSGNGRGGFGTVKRIGTRWNAFSHIFAPGDWSGDGNVDLLAVRKDNGTLWMYPGNGRGGFVTPRQIGTGWASFDSFMPTGDFDGNRVVDFLARNQATGQLVLYKGNGRSGFNGSRLVGTGWAGFTALIGLGDFSGDGRSDVLARTSDGKMRLYRGNGAGGWISPYPVIGTGWNIIRFPEDGTTAPQPVPSNTITARELLASLAVAAESNTGYSRDYFRHWIDADDDGCTTRAEVLQQESRKPITYSSGCTVYSGEWYSYFDGATWALASDVDIDHMVALAEAWGSGARSWTATRRETFANDLAYPYTLEAVTDNVNASKSDRDPAEWMPPLSNARCTYAVRWVAVKYRWTLTVDSSEKNTLNSYFAGSCGDVTLTKPPRG